VDGVVSKEDRRRRREEERNEDLKQAVEDIEWLREHGAYCEWREAQDHGARHYREHIAFGFEDTRTNRGANAYVAERHERIERSDRVARLAELDKTVDGRELLKDAFKIANMKGTAYDV
jgi:hypothetical protein